MEKQRYIIIVILVLVLVILSGFYWYELRPLSIKKDCFTQADTARQAALNADNNAVASGFILTKRADYNEIFSDEYKKCLMKNGIKE